jgi:O-antigen/teichoic acid export membrane protein
MVQLYRDARRDGRASWLRLVGDVVASVPIQHKEAIRTMNTSTKLVVLALVVTTGVVVFAAVGGALVALALMLLLAWILLSLLRERGARPSPSFWWKLTLSGIGVLAFAVLIFGGPWPDSWREAVPSELGWWSGFVIVAVALVMIFAGIFTGIAERVSRRRLTQ